MTSHDLTCQELVELVTEYFEDMLPAEERARFEDHLGECSGCTTYLEQMGQTINLLGQLTEEMIPPQARQELLQIFRDWKPG